MWSSFAPDDLGFPIPIRGRRDRVVSLVPSLTEALASARREGLVGATQWCTHPLDLDVPRVRGTKNPDLRAIIDLRPDLVVANKEENREIDVTRLREAGVEVWVTDVTTVPGSLDSIERLVRIGLGWEVPGWIEHARELWSGPVPGPTHRVVAAVWRDPWMVVGRDTFAGDMLARVGLTNAYSDSPERYPRVDLPDLDRPGIDAVLLPDEPYPFSAADGPEAFVRTSTVLVSGRFLTWYGPSLVEAHSALTNLVDAKA